MGKRINVETLYKREAYEKVLGEYDKDPNPTKSLIGAVRKCYPMLSENQCKTMVSRINSDQELIKRYRNRVATRMSTNAKSVVLTIEERKEFLSETIKNENIGIKSRLEAVKILNHMENVGGNSNTVNIMNLSIEEKREEVRKQIAGLLNGKHE